MESINKVKELIPEVKESVTQIKETESLKLFSLVFAYPTAGTVREIVELAGNLGLERIAETVEKADLDDLKTEYTRLFISAHQLPCPPYESFYREGLVYGNTAVEVREVYAAHGFDYLHESEPPDFVGAELEFLALTKDRDFFGRFKTWVFKFTERVKEHSEVYSVFARELENFLNNN